VSTLTARYTTNPLLLTMARQALREVKAHRAAYAEEVDAWYRSGDGRSPKWLTEVTPDGDDVYQWNAGGRGYTFPHCIHGKSRWTDYDNICGGCEDSLSVYDEALSLAHTWFRDYQGRMATYRAARAAEAPREVMEPLGKWVTECLTRVGKGQAPRPLP
jgi:hypothetical protein